MKRQQPHRSENCVKTMDNQDSNMKWKLPETVTAINPQKNKNQK